MEFTRQNRKEENNTYEGIIIASDWDHDGNIIGLNLLQNNEQEIPIYMNIKAESLINFCTEKARIKGQLQDDLLQVNTFKILLSTSNKRL